MMSDGDVIERFIHGRVFSNGPRSARKPPVAAVLYFASYIVMIIYCLVAVAGFSVGLFGSGFFIGWYCIWLSVLMPVQTCFIKHLKNGLKRCCQWFNCQQCCKCKPCRQQSALDVYVHTTPDQTDNENNRIVVPVSVVSPPPTQEHSACAMCWNSCSSSGVFGEFIIQLIFLFQNVCTIGLFFGILISGYEDKYYINLIASGVLALISVIFWLIQILFLWAAEVRNRKNHYHESKVRRVTRVVCYFLQIALAGVPVASAVITLLAIFDVPLPWINSKRYEEYVHPAGVLSLIIFVLVLFFFSKSGRKCIRKTISKCFCCCCR